jgi:glutathione synthase/RimK-type ligase-like ATP-grasp enzyme
MADADEYETALGHLARATRSLGLPVLNPAEGILRTRRDRAPELLDGIDGLMIPRCVRFSPTRPAHFREVFEREEFQYPVMIRPERSQTAAGLIRVMDEADWDKIYEMPWIGASIYMTQWVDYRQASGWYAKARIVVAGERISVRHILRSREWLIHAMERTEESAAWELPYLEGAGQWEAVQRIGRAVRTRFGLDFFGIDVGMIDENSFVLFEANAAMSILSDYMMPEIRKTEFLANLRRIERDVIAALASKGVPVTAEAASF